MSKELIVSSTSLETKLAIIEDDQVTEIFIERTKSRGIVGNIYKGKVTKVLPGMQAAFVDIGLERHAFLYVSDFLESYEEYEDLFAERGEIGEVLKAEQIQPEESRRGRRSRRGDKSRHEDRRAERQKQREKKEEAPAESTSAPAAAPAPKPAEPEKSERASVAPPVLAPVPPPLLAPVPPPLPLAEALHKPGSILPAHLAPWGEQPPVPDEDGLKGGGAGILPDRFEVPESGGALPDSQAGIQARPEKAELASTGSRKRRNGRPASTPLISDLLREGQEILVQIAKEPIAKKGARITSHVALPGRFLVYMPTVEHVGVSRKIASDKERARLKELVVKLRGEFSRGFIVRTAGEGCTEDDLRQDLIYLTRLWDDIRVKTEKASAPSLIHSEPGLVQRVIRDYLSGDFRSIRVDDEQEYERIVELVSRFSPDLVHRVRLFNKSTPIFDEFGVTAEIERSLKQKVWLKNGGYIVINQTEALVAIDVNTGKYVGRTASLEDTITKTNLDAVKEVVRQIRLRDLGGIIVIDFIDMDERKNRQRVMEALEFELSKDKSPSKILQFNEFGLVAITRKRVKQSLERTLCQPCLYCNGTGMTKSVRTICYSIHQEARKLARHIEEGSELLIRCHPDVAKGLREGESDVVAEIEERTGATVSIKPDPIMHVEQFDLIEL